jgi:pimeloyl-ACP methyl ester carboxylesterase
MGAFQLAHLALLHPSLLQGLVLMDPVIQAGNPGKPFGLASTYRRDLWPSRQAARDSFAKSKFYQAWDTRVFEKWVEAGLRPLPPEVYGDGTRTEDKTPVTLTTAKPQEVYSFLRPLYSGNPDLLPANDVENYADLHPDDVEPDYPFYRPESAMVFRKLPELRPPVRYITGISSPLAGPALNARRLELTGSGVGGSGGAKKGRVSALELECGHFVPMEQPRQSALASAEFVDAEARRWEENTQRFEQQWSKRPRPDRIGLDDEWRERIGPRHSK